MNNIDRKLAPHGYLRVTTITLVLHFTV